MKKKIKPRESYTYVALNENKIIGCCELSYDKVITEGQTKSDNNSR